MTRILVVNPDTSRAMTDTIRTVAESAAALIGVSISVLGAEKGSASVEGRI